MMLLTIEETIILNNELNSIGNNIDQENEAMERARKSNV